MSEPVGVVAGFDDRTMMRDPVKQRGCHLGITEHRDPLAKLQIGGDDNTGVFIELGDEVKEQRASGFWERDVTQFIDNDAMGLAELANDFAGVSL